MTGAVAEPVETPARARRMSPRDLLCAAGLALGVASAPVLTAATPSLLAHHDTLLEALSSSAVSMVTGGALSRVGRASLLLSLLSPLCGVLLVDVFYWWAGRRWGDRVVGLLGKSQPRTARLVERADRWVLRHGLGTLSVSYFLPVPNPLVYLSCGTAGMPLAVFLIGDAIGTLLWTGLLVGLGWQIGKQAVDVVNAVNHYELLITIALVAVLVALNVARQRRGRVRPS